MSEDKVESRTLEDRLKTGLWFNLDCYQCRQNNETLLDILATSEKQTSQLLKMLQAGSIEAAIEQLQHHYDKDKLLIDKYLAARPSVPQQGQGEQLTHGRNCAALRGAKPPIWSVDCSCGLGWRIQLQTEREMHNAWRKRAEEAELALAASRSEEATKADFVDEHRNILRLLFYQQISVGKAVEAFYELERGQQPVLPEEKDDELESGAPAAGSAERAQDEARVDAMLKAALAGTDTDVAKEGK